MYTFQLQKIILFENERDHVFIPYSFQPFSFQMFFDIFLLNGNYCLFSKH